MKNLLLALSFLLTILSCTEGQVDYGSPEPHLELGQTVIFTGSDPLVTYVIVGYRHQLESATQKEWEKQDYVVFLYRNDNRDLKTAAVHRNAVLKN
ncbi:MAG: hypothetical protein LAT68_13880 [Cyclobacteriaceae bacterium]|nr:hypothetical protein [Cyclobacteriaceae bacterium]MCH8517409.1 hypothetical protein [Cyclobacteriaceae bacterium]